MTLHPLTRPEIAEASRANGKGSPELFTDYSRHRERRAQGVLVGEAQA